MPYQITHVDGVDSRFQCQYDGFETRADDIITVIERMDRVVLEVNDPQNQDTTA